MQQQILFKHIFWSNYHLSNFFWNLWRQTNRYSSKKVNIWTPSGYFPFFISFFCWNEINKKSSREDTRKIRSSRLRQQLHWKETLPQVFSCEFCKISKNTFSNRTPPVAATERWKSIKPLQRIFLTQVTGNRVNDHYAGNVYIKVFLYIAILWMLVSPKILH